MKLKVFKKRKKASITIFSILIFIVIFSLLFSLVKSTIYTKSMTIVDETCIISAESGFATYSNKLFDKYKIFGISNESLFNEITQEVFETNIENTGIKLKDIYTTQEYFLTDNNAEGLYRQGISAIKTEKIKDLKELITNLVNSKSNENMGAFFEQLQNVEGNIENAKDIKKEIENIEENNADIKEIKEEIGKTKTDVDENMLVKNDVKKKNAFNKIKEVMKGKLTPIVLENRKISKKAIPDSFKTYGEGYSKGEKSELYEDILFREYMLDKMSYFTKPSNNNQIAYEVEYILSKGKKDEDNLEKVMKKILLIRQGVNFLHILKDPKLRMEAKELAYLLFSASLNPLVVKIGEYAILTMWSFAESISDLKNLYADKKVPVIKNEMNWNVSIENFLSGNWNAKKEDKNGLDYKMYLRILLNASNIEEERLRTADVIEIFMNENGQKDFKMEKVLYRAKLCVETTLPYGGKRYFSECDYSYDK